MDTSKAALCQVPTISNAYIDAKVVMIRTFESQPWSNTDHR